MMMRESPLLVSTGFTYHRSVVEYCSLLLSPSQEDLDRSLDRHGQLSNTECSRTISFVFIH